MDLSLLFTFHSSKAKMKTASESEKKRVKMEKENYRFAKESDVGLIFQFIRELADYEKMLPEVAATEELLQE